MWLADTAWGKECPFILLTGQTDQGCADRQVYKQCPALWHLGDDKGDDDLGWHLELEGVGEEDADGVHQLDRLVQPAGRWIGREIWCGSWAGPFRTHSMLRSWYLPLSYRTGSGLTCHQSHLGSSLKVHIPGDLDPIGLYRPIILLLSGYLFFYFILYLPYSFTLFFLLLLLVFNFLKKFYLHRVKFLVQKS